MNRFRIFGTFLIFTALGAVAQRTAARPDLNGVWKVNIAESDFGQAPPPEKQTETMTQAGDEMAIAVQIERPEVKQNYTLRFRVGGGETPMSFLFPADAPFRILSVRGEWKGAVLVVVEHVTFQASEGTVEARYQLTTGGRKLRKTTHVTMPAGEFDTTTVYDRE
jgi:hypothetical protein